MTERRWLRWALILPPMVVAAVIVAWSLDSSPTTGRVPAKVTLAGRPVGGMSSAELTRVAEELAVEYAGATVQVDAPEGGFVTNAQDLGLVLQVEPTVSRVLQLERAGSALQRFWGWFRSLFGTRPAPVAISVDRNAVYRVVDARDPGPRTPPTEPSIRVEEGRLVAVPGTPGNGIDAGQLIDRLPSAATGGVPIRVKVDRGDVQPRFSTDDAEELARRAKLLTAPGLPVKAGEQSATVPPATVRSWLRARPTEQGLVLGVDHEAATASLRRLIDEPAPVPRNATYDVVDGALTIVPGVPGQGCCADTAGQAVEPAVLEPQGEPVELPVVEVPPEVTAEELAQSGIKEQVSTFTTNHAAGQPRVTNIQLMADLVRGQIVEPGGTFSINEFVGERTPEKGFVVDGVIQNGMFEESVGGGVSQFATTLFNAAFFAGLEFPEYQSHSLYISRYPYGREATLSYPRPDLKIHNPSPYPVLIWPTYTRSSITVSLYSTKWVEAEQTGQTAVPRGPCRLVRTERTITYLADRTTKTDRVNALYRPEEGVNCL